MSVGSVTATTLTVSWSVPTGSVVTNYTVRWERDTSGACPYEDRGTATTTNTEHVVTLLEEYSAYFIAVTAYNEAGGSVAGTTTGRTLAAGDDSALM